MGFKIKKEKDTDFDPIDNPEEEGEAKEKKALTIDQILAKIDKQYGKGIGRLLGDNNIVKVDIISTGSVLLDKALGVGGLPRGRVVEYYGLEAGGKTTMALHAIANSQAAGGRAAFIDAEHALDPELARNLKVDLPNLYLVQPENGEQALDIACNLVESGVFSIIVLDSVAALIPKAELDGEMGDQQMGLQARMMGKALRKLTGITHTTNTCFIFINQLREKIGSFGYGEKSTTPGGKALKFYSSVRLDIRRIGSVKRGDDIIGNQIKIKVVKNKLAPPYKEIETELIFGHGINRLQEILNIGLEKGIIEKEGHSFVYNEEKIGTKETFFEYLRNNPELEKLILSD